MATLIPLIPYRLRPLIPEAIKRLPREAISLHLTREYYTKRAQSRLSIVQTSPFVVANLNWLPGSQQQPRLEAAQSKLQFNPWHSVLLRELPLQMHRP